MRSLILKYFPFVCAGFLLVHFTLSLIYAAPEQLLPAKVQLESKRYTLPLFEQYWSLFAPAPKTNKRLLVRINKGPWQSPDLQLIMESHANRFSSSGRKEILYSNLLYYLVQENCSCSKNKQQVITGRPSASFNALKYALKKELKTEEPIDVVVWTDVYDKSFTGKKESILIIYRGGKSR
ncbi:MAG: hypothetical protein ACJ76F_01785 [Bacteroidia bacterium]